jgi:hypothetical protein
MLSSYYKFSPSSLLHNTNNFDCVFILTRDAHMHTKALQETCDGWESQVASDQRSHESQATEVSAASSCSMGTPARIRQLAPSKQATAYNSSHQEFICKEVKTIDKTFP